MDFFCVGFRSNFTLLLQDNRREYEKRVAAIVEQSWLHIPIDTDRDADNN